MEKLRVFEGFAGIGAVSKAIERLDIPHELVSFSEIDKYAIKSFCAIHGVSADLNYGDVCLIDENSLPDFDLYTFGSPCQDFSVAGKQQGATWSCKDCGHEYNPLDVHYSKRDTCPNCSSKEINKTRSSLVCEALRIIRHKKPKYLLMENVKNLVGMQFKPSFDKILAELEEYGYNTYWHVLNAKNYGIPQNRERVFVVSIRKDVDNGLYKFPKGFDKGIRLKDIVEKQVDEKYYIPQNKTEKLISQLKDKDNLLLDLCKAEGECHTIERNALIKLGNIYPSKGQNGNIYSIKGISPTISSGETGTKGNGGIGSNNAPKIYTYDCRIRKLTPKECWRLTGFDATDFDKAKNVGISDTQLYKQAGNSIVVDVLCSMFKSLFLN